MSLRMRCEGRRWLALFALSLVVGCAPPPPPKTSLDEQPARIVSAFFGLDHAMPDRARWLCRQAPGQDGMPVTFSRRVVGRIDPRSFSVTTRSGARRQPLCATTAPANGPGEDHTVLLIGDLGREPDDPPVSVAVDGPLSLAGADGRGLSSAVTPLADGPTLVLALGFRPGATPSNCPDRTRQIVVAIWAGGVVPGPSSDDESHRSSYRVTTSRGVVVPFALGDLNDNDNYIHLCLDSDAPAQRVEFPPGVVVDPRGDLNPATSVEVSPQR